MFLHCSHSDSIHKVLCLHQFFSKIFLKKSLRLVLSVGFEAYSPTSAQKRPKAEKLAAPIWREGGSGSQAQTDEPYLGRACVSNPSTPECPGSLAVCLPFSLDNTCTQEKYTHKHTLLSKTHAQDVHKHRYALLLVFPATYSHNCGLAAKPA